MALTPHLAAIRFGTGLSPAIAPPDGAAEVMGRLLGPDLAARDVPQMGWAELFAQARDWGRLRRRRDDGAAEKEAYDAQLARMRDRYLATLAGQVARAATTRDGFRERLLWFWADHFTVMDGGGPRRMSVSGYEEDALRPRLAGRFADLLHAAVTHPAMLHYLDQFRSVGPNSERGRRGDGGLNENLAREVLELHTLGAGGPYGQADVRQLAELLTGLGIRNGATRFRDTYVEPGAETVLGVTYGGDDPDEGVIRAVLEDLAVHPATARHVSGKLARHFVADDPPPDLVEAMTARWLATGGDLAEVYAVLLDHPASAAPELRKVRRPIEYVAATVRALGLGDVVLALEPREVRRWLRLPLEMMGQPWQRPPGPDGWPEAAGAWVTPQALAARIEWAMRVARDLPDPPDPRAFVDVALGPLASERTRFAARAAESRADGIGLILTSPEFQRR